MAGDGENEDDVVFDDDFVKRAAVVEPDWRGRKREATRLARKARRARRRQQVVGGARRAGGYLVVAALVVVLLGVAGFGPLGSLKRDSSKPSATARPIVRKRATKKSNSSGSTTTTVYHLLRRSYDRGDCVFFDESPGTGTRDTQVVDCSRPHVIEMTTSIDVGGRFDHFPTNVEWRAVYNRDCAPSIRALLGAPIDPVGRFYPTGVQPSQESWAENDRTVWCGVGALSLTRPAHPFQDVPFTGKVEGTSQARIFPVGSCASTDTAFVVPCSQAHEWEIAGYVELTSNGRPPPAVSDVAGWQRLVGDRCRVVGRGYLGHDPIDDQGASWLPIEPGSWAAGRRTVECVVARFRADHTVASVGSLKG